MVTLALVATACSVGGQLGGGACTDIGCDSQVTFVVAGLDVGEARGVIDTRICFDGACGEQRIRIRADGSDTGGATRDMSVSLSGDRLSATFVLPDGNYDESTTHRATLMVTIPGVEPLTLEREIRLTRTQPNGRGCDPICWQATVEESA